MRLLLVILVSLCATAAPGVQTEDSKWFESVTPLMSRSEQATYRRLPPAEKDQFQTAFWASKAISPEDYFARLSFIDANFGSGRLASGANTDQGRVYLSLGTPDRITRIPSSRIFVPVEIWYYNSALHLGTELQLLFFQKNSIGLPKLYSPVLDTVRSLLLNQAATVSLFGPNDSITESDLRGKLNLGPAEEDVFSAAGTVARGIKGVGSDEIISRVTEPSMALAREFHEQVKSRVLSDRPPLNIIQTVSPFGGVQVDLSFSSLTSKSVDLKIMDSGVPIVCNHLEFKAGMQPQSEYLYRYDLLPGQYSATLSTAAGRFIYTLPVAAPQGLAIRRVQPRPAPEHLAPFVFQSRQFVPLADGSMAAVVMPAPGKLQWTIRQGFAVVWRSEVSAGDLAILDLTQLNLPAGSYLLQARAGDAESEDTTISFPLKEGLVSPVVSMNANLASDERLVQIAHQYMLRGDLAAAARSLGSVTTQTARVEVERARLEALNGQLDSARTRVKNVLHGRPANFDALAALAFIETKFQDYAVAADYYRRALAIQDSAQLREALASLPANR